MQEMKISSTLVNDTQDGVIAYARQLKDEKQGKTQSEINAELIAFKQDFYTDDPDEVLTQEDIADMMTEVGYTPEQIAAMGE